MRGDRKGGDTGLLRVGAPTQAIETLLAAFLPRYRRRHAGVDVHLVEDGGVRLPGRLEHGDMHLALMPAGDARFRWRLLSPVYVVAVVSRFHRWSRRATLEIEELDDTPLLLLRRDFGSRGWFDAACQVAHVRPRMLLESSAPATMPILRRGQALGQWASISWDPRRFLAPYAEAFIDELVAYARRTRPWGLLTRRVPPLSRPREPAE